MAKGTVKWFNEEKGYGFIKQEGVTDDIFVHHTSIQMDGYRKLDPGADVEFDVENDVKGPKAVNVRTVAPPKEA